MNTPESQPTGQGPVPEQSSDESARFKDASLTSAALITTDRFCIYPLSGEDLPFLLELFGDPIVTHFFSEDYQGDRIMTLFPRWLEGWKQNGYGTGVVRDKGSSVPIGFAGFFNSMIANSLGLEVSYMVERTLWGQGIASELLRGIVSHILTHHTSSEILAAPHAQNFASQRVLQRNSFILEREGTNIRLDAPKDKVQQLWRFPKSTS